MDYYEELGVPRAAPAEDIRRAWRNLARLLHPDQHQDEKLRFLAETQMKRLNEVCAVLTDPIERLRYDRALDGIPPPQRLRLWADPQRRWMLATVLALCAIAVVAALYPGPARSRTPSIQPRTDNAAPPLPTPQPARRHLSHRNAPRLEQPGIPLAEAPPSVPDPPPEILAALSVFPPPPALPPAAVSAPQPVQAQPVQAQPESLAGSWFYAPRRMADENAALYPPEFVEVFITERAGTLRGRYRARYKVGDRPISGDVQFSFEGQQQGEPVRLPWTGDGGSTGEVRLELLPEGKLRVNWHASQLGPMIGLASGTATLTRRREF
jgi:hypothetical protein